MKRGFSENKDVDELILLELPDDDLFEACLTNKYIYSICQKDSFWRNRIIKTGWSLQDKPENLSWRDYYFSLNTNLYLNPPGIRFRYNVFQIKENLKSFLQEANLGMYNGEPLQKNLIEFSGVTTYANLLLLFRIYMKMNETETKFMDEDRPFYRVTNLMNKYFDQELSELEREGNFDRNKFTYNKLGSIINKLLKRKRLMSEKLSEKLLELSEIETEILISLM